MSAFAMAHESADTETTPAATASVPEDQSATAEISGVADAAQAVAQESADMDQLGQEQEELGEVQEVIEQESAGLTQEAARYLKIALNRIVGKRASQKIIALENYSSGRSAQESAKRFALESIGDTLKSFWAAIKAQLKKFYTKVKIFFVKMFSGAKKLKDRAEQLQRTANDTTGTIEEKTFSFGSTKAIAVDGKYNDASTVLDGLKNVRNALTMSIEVKKADQYESIIDKAQSLIETEVKKIIQDIKSNRSKFDADAHGITGAGAILSEIKKANPGAVLPGVKIPEDKLAKLYGSGTDEVYMSHPLPGGKAVFSVVPGDPGDVKGIESLAAVSKYVKNDRCVIGADRITPRDVTEGDVKTLTTSQIDKVCDGVIDIAEAAYIYEKAWDRRDKFQAKLEREVDMIIKEIDQESDIDSRVQRIVRGYAESFTAAVRRRTTYESQIISYSLTTANAFLDYAERSLKQYKAK